jgi:hypothetical protein
LITLKFLTDGSSNNDSNEALDKRYGRYTAAEEGEEG